MAFKMDLGALKKGGSKLTKKDTGAFSDIQARYVHPSQRISLFLRHHKNDRSVSHLLAVTCTPFADVSLFAFP